MMFFVGLLSAHWDKHTHSHSLYQTIRSVIVNIDQRRQINGMILDGLSRNVFFVFSQLVQLEQNFPFIIHGLSWAFKLITLILNIKEEGGESHFLH